MRVDPADGLRLVAYGAGRAQLAHTHARVLIQPHAAVVAAVEMPGEDTTLHAVAFGRPGRMDPLRLLAVADPRERAAEHEMFAFAHAYLARYLEWCEANGVSAQIIVTSRAALAHLTNIAQDLRVAEWNPVVAGFAADLTYFVEREAVPGQQAVVVMTELLRTHWVMPLQPKQEEHLAVVLATIDPLPDSDLATLVGSAEQLSMGPLPLPQFERSELAPRLRRYTAARRAGAPADRLQAIRAEIADTLTPVVLRMHAAIQQGIRTYNEAGFQPLPELPAFLARERDAFTRFRALRAAGGRLPFTRPAAGCRASPDRARGSRRGARRRYRQPRLLW
jgi:hypothetical protein